MIEAASHLGEKLQDTLERVGSLGRKAEKKLARARREAANALKGSPGSVREAGEAVDELSEKAAARLHQGAECVRNYGMGGLPVSLKQLIRRHPAGFVTGAAAAGFLIWRSARRK